MRLEDFINETLTEIALGIHRAQSNSRTYCLIINPLETLARAGARIEAYVRDVEFDVALTTSEGKGSGAEGEITVAGFLKAGGRGRAESASSSVSRIRFTVPVLFPAGDPEVE